MGRNVHFMAWAAVAAGLGFAGSVAAAVVDDPTTGPVTLTDAAAPAAAAPPGTLELDVNTTTGDAVLNSGGVSISTVQINSTSSQLIPANWKSITSTYGGSSRGWFEAGKTPSGLGEVRFSGFDQLAAGTTLDYGNIFTPNGIQDLRFTYSIDTGTGTGTLIVGNVVYSSSGVPEPTSLGLAGIAVVGLLGRKRRQSLVA